MKVKTMWILFIGTTVFLACSKKPTSPEVELDEDTYDQMMSILNDGLEYYGQQLETTPGEALENTVDWLEAQSNVKDAGISDDSTTIWLEHTNSIKAAIATEVPFLDSLSKKYEPRSLSPFLSLHTIPNQKAIIIENVPELQGTQIAQLSGGYLITQGGFNNPIPKLEHDDAVTLELLQTLDESEYGFIHIITHGMVYADRPFLWIEREPTFENLKACLDDLLAGRVLIAVIGKPVTTGLSGMGIFPSFIETYGSSGYNGAFVHLTVCYGAYRGRFLEAFCDNGAGVCLGWTRPAGFAREATVIENLLVNMLKYGDNVQRAYSKLGHLVHIEWDQFGNSYLTYLGDDDLTLVGLTFPEGQSTTAQKAPGQIATYSLILQNTFRNDLSTSIDVEGSMYGWEVKFEQNGHPLADPINVPAKGSIAFDAKVSVPSIAYEGTQELTTINAKSEQSHDEIELVTVVGETELDIPWQIFTMCNISAEVVGSFHDSEGGWWTETHTSSQITLGSFSDSIFTGSSAVPSTDCYTTLNTTIIINPAIPLVSSFEMTVTLICAYSDVTLEWSISGTNLPFTSYLDLPTVKMLEFSVSGIEACSHISSLEYRSEGISEDWWRELLGYDCDTGSKVTVTFTRYLK